MPISTNEILDHARKIAATVDLPYSIDIQIRFSSRDGIYSYTAFVPGFGNRHYGQGNGTTIDDAIRNAYRKYCEQNASALKTQIAECQASIVKLEERLKYDREQLQINLNKLATIVQEWEQVNVETNEAKVG